MNDQTILLFFVGFRNALELVALLYWDRAM